MKLTWKPQAPPGPLYRTKVLGGWLIVWYWADSSGAFGGITFYPDPEHKWDGNSMP